LEFNDFGSLRKPEFNLQGKIARDTIYGEKVQSTNQNYAHLSSLHTMSQVITFGNIRFCLRRNNIQRPINAQARKTSTLLTSPFTFSIYNTCNAGPT